MYCSGVIDETMAKSLLFIYEYIYIYILVVVCWVKLACLRTMAKKFDLI